MLDMAALMAEEKTSALIGAGCAGAMGAGSEDGAGASRLPEAQRGTEPDSPATCKQGRHFPVLLLMICSLYPHKITRISLFGCPTAT